MIWNRTDVFCILGCGFEQEHARKSESVGAESTENQEEIVKILFVQLMNAFKIVLLICPVHLLTLYVTR